MVMHCLLYLLTCVLSHPCLLHRSGPLTLVSLSRGSFDRSALIARLVPAYVDAIKQLAQLGVPEVQVR